MELDKNLKINTFSNFNFLVNGKQVKSLDDMPKGLKMISKVLFGNTLSGANNSVLGDLVQNLANNPEIKQAIASKSLHIDPLTKVITYNGKQIKSIEDIPDPFKSMANQILADKNNNQVPDFIEGEVLNTSEVEQNTAEIQQKIVEPPKNVQQSYRPLNVAGNPLSKLQFVLVGILILASIIYFLTTL